MNVRYIVLGLMLASAGITYGQDADVAKSLVLYDPLFWKDKLKLDAFQCGKIKAINSEYYEKLFVVYREEREDQNSLQLKAEQSLQHRSQEIWETFHPKQRKRWKKMWREKYTG